MHSVSYNPFFPMCVHRRTQNPLTHFSPPKAGFSRRALVSVAPFSATGERRPTCLGGGCPGALAGRAGVYHRSSDHYYQRSRTVDYPAGRERLTAKRKILVNS
ncbi:hypothetical protein [Photorhabdus hindustanensis]|uniref:hypothetical protein n=1 Tax=Photorhabdus hindustanensis TaxID=2918802 RepID=UPI003BB7432C